MKKIFAFLLLASFAVMSVPALSQSCCPAGKSTSAKVAKGTCPMSGKGCDMKATGTCPKTGKACTMKSKGTCQMAGKTCPMAAKAVKATKATKAVKAPKKVVSAVCPVMGNKIPDVSKAAGKSVYKGKTYYFCCPACKPMFDKNPEKYVKKK